MRQIFKEFKELVKERIPPQIIVVIMFVIMLVAGYFAWAVLTAGSITIIAPFYQTEIYIDGVFAGTSREAGQKMVYDYPLGEHEVIVSKAGFWPWMQNINVTKKEHVALTPFLIQKSLRSENIPKLVFDGGSALGSSDYTEANALFENLVIPESILSILASTDIKNIRAATFFPGRTDVLIVAANQTVFAIDAYNKKPRNYQPIFTGNSPSFAISKDNFIFVKDGEAIYKMQDLIHVR